MPSKVRSFGHDTAVELVREACAGGQDPKRALQKVLAARFNAGMFQKRHIADILLENYSHPERAQLLKEIGETLLGIWVNKTSAGAEGLEFHTGNRLVRWKRFMFPNGPVSEDDAGIWLPFFKGEEPRLAIFSGGIGRGDVKLPGGYISYFGTRYVLEQRISPQEPVITSNAGGGCTSIILLGLSAYSVLEWLC